MHFARRPPRAPALLALALYPALPAPPAPAAGDDPATALFEDGRIVRLRIDLPEHEAGRLEADPRAYVAADLREGSKRYRNVGLRLKGSDGSFRGLDDKPGLTIKLNQYIPKQRFHGLRKLHLNNAVQDPSYLSEILGNELFRAAGIPAPRTGFARVELNGRDLGLHVLIEGITRDFLERHFENPGGNLYEGPGDITDDIDQDSKGMLPGREDLEVLRKAARTGDPAERWRRLGEALDRDRFITFLAMEAMLWHWDGYATAANNYGLYHDPATGAMVFIPRGIDQLFQDPDGAVFQEPSAFLARAVLETPEGARRYRARVAELLPAVLDAGRIRERARAVAGHVGRALAEADPDAAREQAAAAADLIERIERRAAGIRRQLDE
jgi:spore coat protein CotH